MVFEVGKNLMVVKADRVGRTDIFLSGRHFSGIFIVTHFQKYRLHRIIQGLYQGFIVAQFLKFKIGDEVKFLVLLHRSFSCFSRTFYSVDTSLLLVL